MIDKSTIERVALDLIYDASNTAYEKYKLENIRYVNGVCELAAELKKILDEEDAKC